MVYEQYKDTTVERLTLNIQKLFNDMVLGAVNSFENSIYNMVKAESIGLDIWGKLLNFPRYINSEDDGLVIKLEDDQYRTVLRILAFQTSSEPTIQNINKNMNMLFGDFLKSGVYVVDNGDMEFITYVFTIKLPKWIKVIFKTFDILPRPMGVGVNLIEEDVGILGFEGQKLEDNKITNFNQAIFNPNRR